VKDRKRNKSESIAKITKMLKVEDRRWIRQIKDRRNLGCYRTKCRCLNSDGKEIG